MTSVRSRCIKAVFNKQLKDTLKNKATLIQFVMFPMLGVIFTETIAKGQADLADNYFAIMFATIYAGFVPMVTMASIISEEKEQHTLKMLMMANVKPGQYLVGIGSYVIILCALGACVFGMIGGYVGLDFLKFLGIMLSGVLASTLLGAAIGLLSRNQMTATAMVLPLAMIAAFLPMIAMFNDKFEKAARVLYTQQISYMINDPALENMTAERFLIIGANMAIFLIVFVIAYRRRSLS
ncbi:MAG: ABC transporter permease [Lachnospiraceae bacterium]